MQLKSKLPDVGSTIFTTMSKMAVEYDAINLGQGFPDFNADSKLLNLVSKAMSDGYNQYPYMTGVLELRQAISTKVHSLYGHAYEPDTEITITSGATEAIMSAILATIHSGDEVIVLEPCYDCYIPAIRLAGGKPVRVQMVAPSRGQSVFTVDWDCVKAAITNKTRMLIVNTPHNPTGSIFSDDDLNALENIVDSSDILLLSDEVYEHIIFDKHKHKSLASSPALVHRSFVISSFGKTTHTTGWKVGYCCAPKNLTAELRKVHQFVVFTVPSPFQHALATYTKNPESYLELSKFYEQKRNLLKNGLLKTRFKPLESHGTFFLLADYSQISNQSESEFSIWLAQHHGVVVIPVSAFYAEPTASNANHNIVRFCFAKKDTTLESALDRLMRI
ncbi:methionine aminotransferase [Zwartia sp.]|uniref:methionine aminotransferase n=1 Tax=Zwartia sp. TaxID=2978004 RepID=UPI002719C163|nr:methionine aminotransferase [Zwartia sp.]MDO9023708.1 methionine aminotransferase [Zwartia sp.]